MRESQIPLKVAFRERAQGMEAEPGSARLSFPGHQAQILRPHEAQNASPSRVVPAQL